MDREEWDEEEDEDDVFTSEEEEENSGEEEDEEWQPGLTPGFGRTKPGVSV